MLQYWFNNQMFKCRWKNLLSREFSVRKACRQGGVCSAYFFAIYMDNLCDLLHESGLGCRVGQLIFNHLVYADDVAILATSISSLKRLLKICEEYGKSHNITFNPTKTYLQAFIPHEMDNVRPLIKFCNRVVQWTDSFKYLGFEISCWDRDSKELLKRKRELYMQANLVKTKFSGCSESVRRYIFNTYFSNIYCASLWCPSKQNHLKALQVAYNDTFRMLFGYKRSCSASQMFTQNGIPDFNGMRRRAIFSLIKRLCLTDNPVLSTILYSNVLTESSLYDTWSSMLFREFDNGSLQSVLQANSTEDIP